MKKLVLFTACILGAMHVSSQDVVRLGIGDLVLNAPVISVANYSYSQNIYLAEDIDASGVIDSICYFLTEESSTSISYSNDWLVLLGHTTAPKYDINTSRWKHTIDTVFDGTVSVVNDSICIPFDEPFNYNGVDNLVVAVTENKFGAGAALKVEGTGVSYASGAKVIHTSLGSIPFHPYHTIGGSIGYYSIDIALYGLAQACPKLSNNLMSVSDVTPTSAVLHWEGSTGGNYEIDYALEDIDPDSGTLVNTTSDSLLISSLMPDDEGYRFYVRKICADDTSLWAGPVSFSTGCNIYAVPSEQEGFDQVPSSCWTESVGLLSDSTTFTDLNSSNWYSSGYGNDYSASKSAAITTYVFYAPQSEWLISPTYNLGTGSSTYQLEFDMIGTSSSWNNTNPAALSYDDTIKVLISTDNGITWSADNTIASWDMSSGLPNPSEHKVYDLSAYTGLVKFAIYVESLAGNTQFKLFVDNFKVAECLKSIVINDTSCISYTSPFGDVYTTSGTYSDTINNATCDTVYTYNLSISSTHTSSYVELLECESFVSATGNVYNQTGVYYDTIPNIATCDSVIKTELFVIHIDSSVAQTDKLTLEANESDPVATYQWVNCADLSPISGETSSTLTLTDPDTTKKYACQITIGDCSKLSDCVSLKSTTSVGQYTKSDIKVYPNPNNGQFTLELSEAPKDELNMSISNMLGQQMYSEQLSSTVTPIDLGRIDKGVYIMHLNSPAQSLKTRVVID